MGNDPSKPSPDLAFSPTHTLAQPSSPPSPVAVSLAHDTTKSLTSTPRQSIDPAPTSSTTTTTTPIHGAKTGRPDANGASSASNGNNSARNVLTDVSFHDKPLPPVSPPLAPIVVAAGEGTLLSAAAVVVATTTATATAAATTASTAAKAETTAKGSSSSLFVSPPPVPEKDLIWSDQSAGNSKCNKSRPIATGLSSPSRQSMQSRSSLSGKSIASSSSGNSHTNISSNNSNSNNNPSVHTTATHTAMVTGVMRFAGSSDKSTVHNKGNSGIGVANGARGEASGNTTESLGPLSLQRFPTGESENGNPHSRASTPSTTPRVTRADLSPPTGSTLQSQLPPNADGPSLPAPTSTSDSATGGSSQAKSSRTTSVVSTSSARSSSGSSGFKLMSSFKSSARLCLHGTDNSNSKSNNINSNSNSPQNGGVPDPYASLLSIRLPQSLLDKYSIDMEGFRQGKGIWGIGRYSCTITVVSRTNGKKYVIKRVSKALLPPSAYYRYPTTAHRLCTCPACKSSRDQLLLSGQLDQAELKNIQEVLVIENKGRRKELPQPPSHATARPGLGHGHRPLSAGSISTMSHPSPTLSATTTTASASGTGSVPGFRTGKDRMNKRQSYNLYSCTNASTPNPQGRFFSLGSGTTYGASNGNGNGNGNGTTAGGSNTSTPVDTPVNSRPTTPSPSPLRLFSSSSRPSSPQPAPLSPGSRKSSERRGLHSRNPSQSSNYESRSVSANGVSEAIQRLDASALMSPKVGKSVVSSTLAPAAVTSSASSSSSSSSSSVSSTSYSQSSGAMSRSPGIYPILMTPVSCGQKEEQEQQKEEHRGDGGIVSQLHPAESGRRNVTHAQAITASPSFPRASLDIANAADKRAPKKEQLTAGQRAYALLRGYNRDHEDTEILAGTPTFTKSRLARTKGRKHAGVLRRCASMPSLSTAVTGLDVLEDDPSRSDRLRERSGWKANDWLPQQLDQQWGGKGLAPGGTLPIGLNFGERTNPKDEPRRSLEWASLPGRDGKNRSTHEKQKEVKQRSERLATSLDRKVSPFDTNEGEFLNLVESPPGSPVLTITTTDMTAQTVGQRPLQFTPPPHALPMELVLLQTYNDSDHLPEHHEWTQDQEYWYYVTKCHGVRRRKLKKVSSWWRLDMMSSIGSAFSLGSGHGNGSSTAVGGGRAEGVNDQGIATMPVYHMGRSVSTPSQTMMTTSGGGGGAQSGGEWSSAASSPRASEVALNRTSLDSSPLGLDHPDSSLNVNMFLNAHTIGGGGTGSLSPTLSAMRTKGLATPSIFKRPSSPRNSHMGKYYYVDWEEYTSL